MPLTVNNNALCPRFAKAEKAPAKLPAYFYKRVDQEEYDRNKFHMKAGLKMLAASPICLFALPPLAPLVALFGLAETAAGGFGMLLNGRKVKKPEVQLELPFKG